MNRPMIRKIAILPVLAGFLVTALLTSPLLAREKGDESLAYKRYVIELMDPPLALYDGGELSVEDDRGLNRMAATAPAFSGKSRLNSRSPESTQYLGFLTKRRQAFKNEAAALLGRTPVISHQFRMASNGMAMHLTADEAAVLAESPLVKSINQDVVYKLDTYAGPEWLNADVIWNGDAGYPVAGGEGIVVGIIDTGINWDHPSFDDGNYDYSNPLGEPLGLCSDAEVLCNDKLIGVYDFVEDDPSTEDWVEENTKGKDNNGHGSHTAATAVGAPVNVFINNASNETLSGVAPQASLVSYRVCYMGEPNTSESEGCSGSAIMAAIDQAISDGVDVINYSIGGDARNPWGGATADSAFLAARSAGIFVASSAGNTGPNESTVTSPALAPWIVAVGNSSHGTIFGNKLQNFSGGGQPVPEDLVGASLTDGTGKLVIVHAKDYGYPLCGVGEPELQPTCNSNTGASNPWEGSTPFNGEIVVCDRGIYGRIEKSKNLLQAGAGGYVLANTAEQGESVVADEHCIPGTHLGRQDGDKLRAWLDEGAGHGASISDMSLVEMDSAGDQLSFSSSRGPAVFPVEDTMKPNVIAPGTAILAAGFDGEDSFLTLTGTSMSSPHVAGSAALLKSVHNDWGVSQLVSAIETTATKEIAKDENGQPATTEQVGAGRPQLDFAVNAGLYLDVSTAEFLGANPSAGGDPKDLNLSGLVDSRCKGECTFTRTVSDQMGGGEWTATVVDFPVGTQVTVTPSSFSLGDGMSRQLDITVNVESSGVVGDWVSGKIKLSASGSSDQYLTVSAYSYGGNLPSKWTINADSNGGWTEFGLTNLVALPSATFTAGGFSKPEIRTETLIEDPSNDDPYDGGSGVFTQWHNLPQGALWIYAETLASTATDLDLFVGRDEDGNNRADEWEELCSSTTPQDLERCDLYNQPPGNYWILVQNWTGTNDGGDEVSLKHAAIAESGSSMAASGQGIVEANAPFPVRVSWDNLAALPQETWLGAVGVGSNAGSPNNIGVIPVEFTRSGIAAAETFPLMAGKTHALALDGNGRHDRIFIDVPPSTASLSIRADGASDEQSNALTLELVRLDFDQGLTDPPFASPAGNGTVVVSASGSGGNGPVANIVGGVESGRWYAVLSNSSASPASVEIKADLEFQGTPSEIHPGLWEPRSRPGLGQGYDYNWSGPNRALIWYTYDEAGLPQWFIAGAPEVQGNIWTTDILRFTNDGENQQSAPVGTLSITQLARDDALFTYTLFGKSGTERMMPISPLTCPQSNASYTGIWYRGVDGLGGASVLVNSSTQTQIHYLYDDLGLPRWLYAQDVSDPDSSSFPILQFSGYCAVCDPANVGFVEVGTLGRSFESEDSGSWTLDYMFDAPPNGSANRTDQVVKITQRLDCQ